MHQFFDIIALQKAPKLDTEWSLVIAGIVTYLASIAVMFCFNMWNHVTVNMEYFKHDPDRREYGTFFLGSLGICIVMPAIIFVLYRSCHDKVSNAPAGTKIGFRAAMIVLVMCVLSTFTHMIGQIDKLHKLGLNGSVFSLILGIIFGNLPITNIDKVLDNAKLVKGEDLIKLSLVCMVVPMSLLVKEIVPSLIVTSSCLLTLAVGLSMVNFHKEIGLLLAVATAICGASAATAVNSVMQFDGMYLSTATGISSLGTVIFMIVVPIICRLENFSNDVCGAWIGGSIDSTGTVVAAAESVSQEAEETAVVVKMTQNLYILPVTLGFMMWKHYTDEQEEAKAQNLKQIQEQQENDGDDEEHGNDESTSPLIEKRVPPKQINGAKKGSYVKILSKIWELTPKFVLAFVMVGIVNVVVEKTIRDAAQISNALSARWEGAAFILLGMEIRFKQLMNNETASAVEHKTKSSSSSSSSPSSANNKVMLMIALLFFAYIVVQTADCAITFGFAKVAF